MTHSLQGAPGDWPVRSRSGLPHPHRCQCTCLQNMNFNTSIPSLLCAGALAFAAAPAGVGARPISLSTRVAAASAGGLQQPEEGLRAADMLRSGLGASAAGMMRSLLSGSFPLCSTTAAHPHACLQTSEPCVAALHACILAGLRRVYRCTREDLVVTPGSCEVRENCLNNSYIRVRCRA